MLISNVILQSLFEFISILFDYIIFNTLLQYRVSYYFIYILFDYNILRLFLF